MASLHPGQARAAQTPASCSTSRPFTSWACCRVVTTETRQRLTPPLTTLQTTLTCLHLSHISRDCSRLCTLSLCHADPSKLRYVKASNILGLLPRPYDRDTFPLTTRILEDAQGRQTFELPCQNTIRFRWVTLEDGSIAPQTNTR